MNNSRISGIENFVLLVCKYIDRDKYDLTVAVPFRGALCDELQKLGVRYIVFNRENSYPYNVRGIFNIFLHFLGNRYDVVHANAGIVPCVLSKLLLMPMAVEHKHGLDFTHEKRVEMKGLKLMYEKTKKYFADMTLTGCELDRRYLVEKFNYKLSRTATLYNGIDGEFENESGNKRREEFVVGTIGRLSFQKAQEHFIEMARLIINERKNLKIRFEIWGEGEEKERYRDMIISSGLENHVFLMGYADKRADVYKKFDLFVLTSRYEGIPFVIPEAMSAGIPVVTTDAGGISEIIENETNGLLVEKERPELLKDAVLRLYDDESLCNKFRTAAFKDYKKNWDFAITAEKLQNIYQIKNK